MEHYELLVIVSSKILEDELDSILEKLKADITAEKGEVTLTKNLGKKKFSYPIAQMRYGYYILLEFDFNQQEIKSLDKKLSLDGKVIRHQIVKIREKTEEEIRKEEKRKEQLEQKVAGEAPLVTAQTAPREVDKRPVAPPVKEKVLVEKAAKPVGEEKKIVEPTSKKVEKKGEEKKITLEELDEKLDKLLEEDIINE